jgi:uracil-DNA glycosylase
MENLDINITNLREQLNEKLKDSGWYKMLSPYINGLSFDHIVNTLVYNVEGGKRFTPRFKDIFNAFYECNYDDLKVVIVGQDPYTQLGIADGLIFSCSKTGKAEKYLQYILKETIGDFTDTGRVIYTSEECDLRRWASQGVLLFSTALTCEINKVGSHYGIWKSFTEYLFDNLNKHKPRTIFILMGKKSEEWQIYMGNQKIFKVTHPAAALYNEGKWNSKDVFNLVNEELIKQGKTCIKW